MSIEDLYSSTIRERSQYAAWTGRCAEETDGYMAHNPLCGDTVHISVTKKDDVILEARSVVSGCVFCRASAATLMDGVQGKSVQEIQQNIAALQSWVQDPSKLAGVPVDWEPFAPILVSPMRVKCVTLSWHALLHLLSQGASGADVA